MHPLENDRMEWRIKQLAGRTEGKKRPQPGSKSLRRDRRQL
jgi:hypothetical protein